MLACGGSSGPTLKQWFGVHVALEHGQEGCHACSFMSVWYTSQLPATQQQASSSLAHEHLWLFALLNSYEASEEWRLAARWSFPVLACWQGPM